MTSGSGPTGWRPTSAPCGSSSASGEGRPPHDAPPPGGPGERPGPRAVRLARVAGQRGWSPAEAAAREKAQLPLAEKAARADVAVDNADGPDALAAAVDRLLDRLRLAVPEPVAVR